MKLAASVVHCHNLLRDQAKLYSSSSLQIVLFIFCEHNFPFSRLVNAFWRALYLMHV